MLFSMIMMLKLLKQKKYNFYIYFKNIFHKMNTLRILIIFLLGLLTTTCHREPDLKIGFLLDEMYSQRWEETNFFVKDIENIGGECIVKTSKNDPDLQYNQALELIKEKVDVLVILPVDSKESKKIVDKAKENNIKVISYERMIPFSDVDFHIAFDNYKIGKAQAEYLIKNSPYGTYALIGGPLRDNNSYLLKAGQLSILDSLVNVKKIRIIYEVDADNWRYQDGFYHMENIIKNYIDKGIIINGIILGNDEMAEGAIDALKYFDIKYKPIIISQDGNFNTLKRIIECDQDMTIYKPVEILALNASIVAYKIAYGEKIETLTKIDNGYKMVPSILLNPLLVDKENIKLTLSTNNYRDDFMNLHYGEIINP